MKTFSMFIKEDYGQYRRKDHWFFIDPTGKVIVLEDIEITHAQYAREHFPGAKSVHSSGELTGWLAKHPYIRGVEGDRPDSNYAFEFCLELPGTIDRCLDFIQGHPAKKTYYVDAVEPRPDFWHNKGRTFSQMSVFGEPESMTIKMLKRIKNEII